MKKLLIVALVCINVALLLALVLGSGIRQAKAQGFRTTDYIMLSGKIGGGQDALYVVDLARERLIAWRYDMQRKRLIPYRGRELKRDFRAAKAAE